MINHGYIHILLYGKFMEKYIHSLIALELIVQRDSYQYLDNLHFQNFMVHLYVQ
jgi:hypothetical protein